VLEADLVEKTIPRMKWMDIVDRYTKAEQDHFSNFLELAHSMIISEIMDIILLEPHMEEADILRELLKRLYITLASISRGPKVLWTFMHSPNRRVCECLAYVATAAEIGALRATEEFQREAKHCTMCGQAVANQKICSRCQSSCVLQC